MVQFNVQQFKKLYNIGDIQFQENTPQKKYISVLHQKQKDSVSFSGGSAIAKKASSSFLPGMVNYLQAINISGEPTTPSATEIPNTLASLDITLNTEPFNQDEVISTTLYIVKKDPDMVNDVVGKISSFLILKNDNQITSQLLSGLFVKIKEKITLDRLNTLDLIFNAFINLPPEETNNMIKTTSELLLENLNLLKSIYLKYYTLKKELEKGETCDINIILENSLFLAAIDKKKYKEILDIFLNFIKNNEKNNLTNLNNRLFSGLSKKSKCYPPTTESQTATYLLYSLKSKIVDMSKVTKQQIQLHILLLNNITSAQKTYEASSSEKVNTPQTSGNTLQSSKSIFSTPQTEEYKEKVKAKIATFEPITGINGEHLKQTLYINGKAMEFECYQDKHMGYKGSNGGYFVYNSDTQDLCWFKAGREQSKAEAIASQLYSLAGIPVAEMKLCSQDNGTACIISRYLFLEHAPASYEEKKKLNQGFGMDVLLANWDAVISNNAQMSGEQAYRVDFEGTFNFSAQGNPSPTKFISIPDEITSMFNPQYGSYNMFATMTLEDLIKSLKTVCKINDHDMAVILQKSHLKRYTNTLLKRKKCLKEMLYIIKAKPKDDNVSMFDYLTNIKHEVIKNHITNASKASEITELQMALDKITVPNIKQELQEALNARKAQIETSLQHTKKQITKDELQNLLTSSIYTQNQSGEYVLDTNKPEYEDYIKRIDKRYNKYPFFLNLIKLLLNAQIYSDTFDKMLQMLNYDNGKFIDIFTKDIKSFVIFYNAVQMSIKNITTITPQQFEALVNSFIRPANQNEMLAIVFYKSNRYKDINETLTQQKQEPAFIPNHTIQTIINILTSYIQTQEVPQDMVVIRGEEYEVLNSAGNVTVQFNDGSFTTKPLGELLKEAKKYSEDKRNELIDQLLSMNLVATQERFMSTSINNPFNGNILWELTVPAGSHAAYIDLAYKNEAILKEQEFLLQRDSQIQITSITFKNGKWLCKGIVNTP